jgi:diketogulonate reductase-like aldo/keto reductase
LERILSDLKVEYLDLFLIHFPIALEYVDFKERYPAGWSSTGDERDAKISSAKPSIRETWEAMVR